MIDALIAGKMYGQPSRRTSKNGRDFTTAKIRCATGDGGSIFINVICFSDTAGAALLALAEGDSVALSGELTPKVWTDKSGEARPALDMTAHAVLTPYHVNRKRKSIQGDDDGDGPQEPRAGRGDRTRQQPPRNDPFADDGQGDLP